MPISHEWADETHTKVCITLKGQVEYADYYAGDIRMCDMLDGVNHPVDVICDYRHHWFFEPGYADWVQEMESIFRPNLRSAIYVGNKMAWELFNLFTQKYKSVGFVCTYVETMEEAHQVIEQIRSGRWDNSTFSNDPKWN